VKKIEWNEGFVWMTEDNPPKRTIIERSVFHSLDHLEGFYTHSEKVELEAHMTSTLHTNLSH
jgi:hypothetical protein